MIIGTMTPADGVELQFVVQEVRDGEVKVILYVGGRVAARLDEKEQVEFLRYFLQAQEGASEVRRDLRAARDHDR